MDKILEKNLLFHSSGDSSRVTIGTGGAFSMWPNITPQKPTSLLGYYGQLAQLDPGNS